MSVYFDHNATAPLLPAARDAMVHALSITGNPSSVHAAGREVRALVENAREQVAKSMGVPPASIVFTSGGTEANNHVVALHRHGHIIASSIEHDSLLAPAREAKTCTLLPASRDGLIDLVALERELAAPSDLPRLVSVMLANNETGVVQPLAEVVRLARQYGATVHSDAIQAAGRVPLDMVRLGLDYMTLSAHKIGGPKGVGALVLRPGLEPAAFMRGGGQEMGRRAGTENVAAIAGFGAAAAALHERLALAGSIAALRDQLEARILGLAPDALIHGRCAARLCNTSCIGMPNMAAETQVMAFDLAGIAVSAGSACSSGKVRPSHVLSAMGFDETAARSAVRFSLGPETTAAQVDQCVEAWAAIYRRASRRVA